MRRLSALEKSEVWDRFEAGESQRPRSKATLRRSRILVGMLDEFEWMAWLGRCDGSRVHELRHRGNGNAWLLVRCRSG